MVTPSKFLGNLNNFNQKHKVKNILTSKPKRCLKTVSLAVLETEMRSILQFKSSPTNSSKTLHLNQELDMAVHTFHLSYAGKHK
jgi:hypothetical protein